MANRKFKIGGVSADNAKADARSATPIYDENQPPPPAGPYRVSLKNVTGGETGPNSKNPGTPKFRMVAEINEEAGTKKAKYNGFAIWYHMNITDENAGNVNQFLDVITDGKPKSTKDKVRQAFWQGNIMADDADKIVKIGTFAIPDEILCAVNATTKAAQGQYPAGLNLKDLFPMSGLPEPEAADEEDEEDIDAEESEGDAEEGDAEERAEELEEMSLADLKKVAKEHGLKTIKKDAETLIEEILAAEFPESDEDEDEDDEEEPDEDEDEDEGEEEEEDDDERAELEGLTLAKLKARAKEEGYKLADYKGLDKDGLIDLILGEESDEEDEDDEDEEEEPEPPKKTRGTAARRTKGKRPPF